ncbi:MAG: hypothetical protein J5720_06175 [Bacteroidaceae bacterium]|nr:hypothetical protein [Bacteroidaceae bacterium]
MKKCLLLMMALLSLGGLSVKAQSFEFQYQGHSLKDGDVVTIAVEEDSFGELSCETNPSSDPNNGLVLKLLSSFTANVKATLQITYNTLSPQMLQWCMGGECWPVNDTDMFTKQFTVTDNVQVQFDAINIHSKGYLLATLKAYIGLESHQVTIQFTNGESADIREMTIYPQTISVYDLKGCRVEGALSPGIYIITDGTQKRKVFFK